MANEQLGAWSYLGCFTELRSPWLRVLGEHWQDHQQQNLEYWRVEKADAIIILPLLGNQLLLAPPQFRPGLQALTWDFPGGRLLDPQQKAETIYAILQRELGVPPTAIAGFQALNPEAWPINSSFSNQKLYGFVATLDPQTPHEGEAFPLTASGLKTLLDRLVCLQCRALLLEFIWRSADLSVLSSV